MTYWAVVVGPELVNIIQTHYPLYSLTGAHVRLKGGVLGQHTPTGLFIRQHADGTRWKVADCGAIHSPPEQQRDAMDVTTRTRFTC